MFVLVRTDLEILVVVVGQGHIGRVLDVRFVLPLGLLVKGGFRRAQRRRFDKVQLVVARQLARQPQKGLFEIVVGLGGNIVVLQILLAVEGDLLGLDLAVLDFDLVSHEDDGNVFADAGEIAVPVGHVLVGDARGHVKHDNGALSLDVVSVAQPPELFLSRRVPDVELDGSAVGEKGQRVDLHSEGGDVLLFEFSRQVAFDKGGLADAAVTDEDELEFGRVGW